ncbi:MAG TPA: class I SAM-dependent methyltransferase [Candidatus Kapabacteria bacterium]|nr:class I SAM-dependent methyltransferase [Candidatus Kapabacteria bacterium]
MNPIDHYGEPLVLRVNELFYDHENDDYRDVHEEMLGREGERWRIRAERFFQFAGPATVIDIGSGAGLVGMSIGSAMREDDRLICADLSGGMLEVARRNLQRLKLRPALEFVKISGSLPYRLPFGDETADVVTMNSVLHHVKDTAGFLAEIDRILKPGGLVMIGHEPNRAFNRSWLLRLNYALLRPLFIPKNFLKDLLLKTGLRAAAERLYYAVRPGKRRVAGEMLDRINAVLAEEKLFHRPLRLAEVALITDIRDAEGFIGNTLLPDFELVDFETYHPISLISIKYGDTAFIGWLDRLLERRYPTRGATFFAVYRKRK